MPLVPGATIYYYPHGSRELKAVDTGKPLSEIAVRELRDEVSHEAISGRRFTIGYSSRIVVRAISELITDQEVVHELEAVCNHLRAGGTIALAEARYETLGSFLKYAPPKGTTALSFSSNLYKSFGGVYTAAAGEVLVMRGPSPRLLREDVVALSVGAGGAVLSTPTRYDWEDQGWVFAHNRGFWPALKLQRGSTNADLLQSTRRIHYTLDLPLEENPSALARLAEAPKEPLIFEKDDPGQTLDERAGQILGRHGNPNIDPFRSPSQGRWF